MTRRIRRPTIADMMKAFGCIDAMLAKLADGWIHEIQGAPVFLNPKDGVWYEIPAAMEGWIALWERIDARYTLCLDLDPARAGRAVPGSRRSVQAGLSKDGCVRDRQHREDAADREQGG